MVTELDAGRAASPAQVRLIAQKIQNARSAPYLPWALNEGQVQLGVEHHRTASIGVALILHHELSHHDILKRADAAMCCAKAPSLKPDHFFAGALGG